MKKLAVSIIVAFAFCMAAAVAQTGTDPSQGTPGASPNASQSSTPSQEQPSQSQPNPAAGQTSKTSGADTGAAEKAEKKMRGCVQSQGGQYVLESKKGKAIALTGQDVSAHVGHEVSLKGTWESGGAGAGVSSSGSASSEKAFNVTSVDMISETCGGKSSKGNSGSMGTSPNSSNPAGTGSTSNPPQQ